MNRALANRMLDRLKAGEADYSPATISALLHATGDLGDQPFAPAAWDGFRHGPRPHESLRARALLEAA